MNTLELKIPPVALGLIFAVIMLALARGIPTWHVTLAGSSWLAAGIASLGLGAALAGVLAFRAAGTTVDPRLPEQSSQLVIRGIYRLSRNPMYVGFLLLLIAWAVWLSNVAACALLPLFVMYMNRFQIQPEERAMQAKFGDSYRHYCRQVRRWI